MLGSVVCVGRRNGLGVCVDWAVSRFAMWRIRFEDRRSGAVGRGGVFVFPVVFIMLSSLLIITNTIIVYRCHHRHF